MSNTIEIPVGAVPWIVGSMAMMLHSQKRRIDELESIDKDHDAALEEIDRLTARIKELEDRIYGIAAESRTEAEPPAPWKTPLPEGHEQWVQRMQECPEEFVRDCYLIRHRSDLKDHTATTFPDQGLFVYGDDGRQAYPLTPALRAAIDKMEVVG